MHTTPPPMIALLDALMLRPRDSSVYADMRPKQVALPAHAPISPLNKRPLAAAPVRPSTGRRLALRAATAPHSSPLHEPRTQR